MSERLGGKQAENEQNVGGIRKHVNGKTADGVPCSSL